MSYHDCANCAWITDRLFGADADITALRKELERVDLTPPFNANQHDFIAKELHVQIARRTAYENTLEAHIAAYHIATDHSNRSGSEVHELPF